MIYSVLALPYSWNIEFAVEDFDVYLMELDSVLLLNKSWW
jgi:hypothetical protein